MLLVTCLCYTLSAVTLREKLMVFVKSLVVLMAVFGVLAFINERYTKPILKSQRPSHLYMLGETGLAGKIDSLYQLDKADRQLFFADLIQGDAEAFRNIDPSVLAHWTEEAGFSFPSGHSFNAYLFAMILAYAILFNRTLPALRKFYILPFVWALLVAVSRVALGAHTALDVLAGGLLGISLGWLFLYSDRVRHWLTRK